MTRLLLLAVLAVASLGACDKPTPEACRKALVNMQHLLGTEGGNDTSEIEGEVRRCRGASSKEAVECASKATTLDELKACKFMNVPGKAPASGSGSAK
jgi:hypothetical protein